MSTLNVKELRISNLVYFSDEAESVKNALATIKGVDEDDNMLKISVNNATINNTESRIGFSQNEIEGWGSIIRFSGIPLTEHWLLKLGLRQDEERHFTFPKYDRFHIYHPLGQSFSFCDGDFWISNKIAFVHQLQNLYFTIFGEELLSDKTSHL